MLSRWTPAAVDVKSASPQFWARYHAYRRSRHAETHPEDAIEPDSVVEAKMKRGDPFSIIYRYEIADGSQMLSWFRAEVVKPETPEYETNKHLFWADWSVHRDHRRHGIGRSWLPLVLKLMDRHSCTTLSLETDEESGHTFLQSIGAEARSSGAENRLNLAEVDWAMLRRWVAEGSKRSPRTSLDSYDGRVPREMWDEYCPALTAMLNTMPWDQLDHGDIVVTPAQLEEWYARRDLAGELNYTMLTREPDGTISGITDMDFQPYRPTLLQQQFTGVRPDARGRGLGKWLKAAMLLHMRDLYPQAKWVTTGNAGSNAPMLAINKKLGFKEFRVGAEYQMSRDRLAATIQELVGTA